MHLQITLDKCPIIKLMNLFHSRNMNDWANPHLLCFLEAYLGSLQASMKKAFSKIRKRLLAVDYFS